MGKTRISREITINAPRHAVWTAITDFGHLAAMNPNIAKSYLTSPQTSGVGTTRHCEMAAFGATLEERVIGWDEDNYLEIEVYEFENLTSLKKMHEYLWLDDEADKTVLRGTFEYEVSDDIGSIMNALVIQRINIKTWDEFLAGTKKYVETHMPVDRREVLHTEEVRTIM